MAIKVNIYNITGKVTGKISLPEEIFAAKINEKLIAQAIRVYLANQRQGTASIKTRGEVEGSGRKIWRQKGTGRARHGDRYAPIFVGGGVAHGPKPKDFSLKLPKKMKKKALFGTLTDKLKKKQLVVVSNLGKMKPKTKEMLKVLENLKLKLENGRLKTKVLLVIPKGQKNIILAGRNLTNLTLCQADLLNPYQVLKAGKLILAKETISVLKTVFLSQT